MDNNLTMKKEKRWGRKKLIDLKVQNDDEEGLLSKMLKGILKAVWRRSWFLFARYSIYSLLSI